MTRLTKSSIKALPAGTVKGDGGNLWIANSKTGRKRWEFRYTFSGKRRCMGLGPWPEVDLNEARDKAFANRKLLIEGIDPLAEKHTHKPRKVTTFGALDRAGHGTGYRRRCRARSWRWRWSAAS